MSTPTPNTTDHTITGTDHTITGTVHSGGLVTPERRVCAELDALQQQLMELVAIRPTNDAEWATRSARMAMLCARRAGWWRVLARAVRRSDSGVHWVYQRAVIAAAASERDDARFWRESAADWTDRAERRPTSDAAGALSNWHELGVTP